MSCLWLVDVILKALATYCFSFWSFFCEKVIQQISVWNGLTEVVFYGENAIERHVKAVHPAEYNLYFANETENARMTKQRAEGKSSISSK